MWELINGSFVICSVVFFDRQSGSRGGGEVGGRDVANGKCILNAFFILIIQHLYC